MSASSPASAAPPPAAPREHLLVTMWRVVPRRSDRLLYAAAIVTLLFANLLAYLAPLVGSATLDLALPARQSAAVPEISQRVVAWLGGAEHLRAHLWLGALATAGLTAASGCFAFFKGWLAALASDRIARELKTRLYDHLQHLPTRYHDKVDSGDIVQRCTSDVETVRLCLAAQVVEIGNAFLLVATALPLMLLVNVRMTVLSFLLLGPIVGFGVQFFRRVKTTFRGVDEAEGRVTSVVQENLNGIRVVRAFARQDYENRRFAGPNAEYRDRSLKLLRLMAWYWSASDLVCLLQNGIVLLGGAWMVAHGELTVGGLFAFLTFLNLLLWPVRMMGRILTDLGKTTVSLARIGEILAVQEEPARSADDGAAPGSTAETPAPAAGRIEFRDVVFTHAHAPDGVPASATAAPAPSSTAAAAPGAVNGVSLTIEPGETVAMLGPSGSGKSTLIHLLLRLYDAQGGAIRLDGRDIRAVDRKWVRAQFGVVMQEPFLYSKTLRDNIRFGRTSASEADVADAARTAAIHDTIVGFDSGYDTMIGERGITLSGGQRQRVAIARAVLRDPPVLVLDDALSAVDSETEIAIIDALRRRRGRRTTILIAHRLSTLAHADRIAVLEHGRLVQLGSHAELVAQPGLYQRLWRIQTQLDHEIAAAAAEEVLR